MTAQDIIKKLEQVADSKRAVTSARFFKTDKGMYGEGDVFIGVRVPEQRKIAKQVYAGMSFDAIATLLAGTVHEHRFTALEILVYKYDNAESAREKKQCLDFYIQHLDRVNNWDLVDTSAHQIVGEWLAERKDRRLLDTLARSENMWANRVAIVATYACIKRGQYDDTLRISEVLLSHEHDLIHKAVGWMLREVGKKNIASEEAFLKKHYQGMPRTMLRYAIERFPEAKRQRYLKGEV